MSVRENPQQKQFVSETLCCLTDRRRRRVLTVLTDRSSSLPERTLAAKLALSESVENETGVSREDVDAVHAELRHRHLPKLADHDLVRWEKSDGTVAATDHPLLEDERFRLFTGPDADDWDAVLESIANDQRRAVLAVLQSRDGTVSLSDLAPSVTARTCESAPKAAVDEVSVGLHHVALPALEDAGLVRYDGDEGTVAYRGHPDLPEIASLDL